ncbi:MAG: Histone acetyltransferase, ELP3 family [Candidatus Pacebacteria bacterium GW2011_GWB1_47_8]|nr:MAG: Histone acetyltransferase, ELP3 family [Candidatus Pacebacteria bacterium GW2011_GWA1_46_10]KKU84551.1 MAG: Histone acetyltransferase, ELP3 family [Candidatus Pacebacteria bacterium GW2011_GWB1_47_8]HCR81668.1 histone acetyltransferase [Candidatus Paceibacterota bacterium]
MKPFYYTDHLKEVLTVWKALEQAKHVDGQLLQKLIKRSPLSNQTLLSKTDLITAYKQLAGTHGLKPYNEALVKKIMMKPTRTISGVAPVTVLTKPFPCPGKCIFCPNDIRMPKSYMSDEPGAQRAERNYFDPYLQTYNRLNALSVMGHPVDKVELIILGGTWSYYPESYQIWFIKECFRALNEFGFRDDRTKVRSYYRQKQHEFEAREQLYLTDDPKENAKRFEKLQVHGEELTKRYNQVVSEVYTAPERKLGLDRYQSATWDELTAQQKINETGEVRNVGLVIETRPDNISKEEVIRVRKLGCTKTQIGVQSLQDSVLAKNHRGHDVAATRHAFKLLRQAGFKIHAHWMANLYGSDPALDKKDYELLFSDPDFHPDELKIYPCSLIESAELMQYYQAGKWQPYTHQQLLDVLSHVLLATSPYCRLTRVIRDIPSTDIVVGNKKTNFRQIAEAHLEKLGQHSHDIRAREIRGEKFDPKYIKLKTVTYQTSVAEEQFLQYVVPTARGEKLLAFLRLSLPKQPGFIDELKGSAIIREVHVYGPALKIGAKAKKHAQHLGLGTRLMAEAKKRARKQGFKRLSVISAIGTREYYRKKGFSDGQLYQHMGL